MSKMTGAEEYSQIPPKVLRLYRAVIRLIERGADPAILRVSDITQEAGIGKGTAYEYFDSKEEIVLGAVVYQIQAVAIELEGELQKRASFEEQVDYLLDAVSVCNTQKNCFFKLVHILTDNSEFSNQVHARMNTKAFERYRLVGLFRQMLGAAAERGELRRDLPLDYMVFSLGARIFAYMVAASEEGLQVELPRMRELVFRGIMEELQARGASGRPPKTPLP